MQTIPLEGFQSFFAVQAYAKILLGLKMLPSYMKFDYVEFYKLIEEMPPHDQEKMIREAVLLVDLTSDEVTQLARWCQDNNGVRYSEANMKKLPPDKIYEIIVLVCLECAKIKINFITEAEKKNSMTSQ